MNITTAQKQGMDLTPIITDDDRKDYQSYTDGAIFGIKIVKSLSDDELMRTLKDKAMHETVRAAIGTDTNPSWLTSRVAEELYYRGVIDCKQMDFISEYGGLEMPL